MQKKKKKSSVKTLTLKLFFIKKKRLFLSVVVHRCSHLDHCQYSKQNSRANLNNFSIRPFRCHYYSSCHATEMSYKFILLCRFHTKWLRRQAVLSVCHFLWFCRMMQPGMFFFCTIQKVFVIFYNMCINIFSRNLTFNCSLSIFARIFWHIRTPPLIDFVSFTSFFLVW